MILNLIKDIYVGDLYVLIDGVKVTVIHPEKGVKQGCPLSPTLFALFISNLPEFLRSTDHTLEAVTSMPDFYVHVSEIADDLALFANVAAQLVTLLNRLHLYSLRKGLTVKPDKSNILESNHRVPEQFFREEQPIEKVSEFKYLGILFHREGHMMRAAARMQEPCAKAMAKVRKLVKRERLTDNPFATLWLFQVIALPASLYGCQVWGTSFLHSREAAKTGICKSSAIFFKRFLGLPVSASTRCVLRECGQLPLHFYFAGAWYAFGMLFFGAQTHWYLP